MPYTYYPDAVGGTEIYVEQLTQSLRALGIENLVVAPGARATEYLHRDVRVLRIPVSEKIADVAELYGEGDTTAADFIDALMEREKINVVHMHALTRIVSPQVAKRARARGIPVVFTYHTPAVSCARGTLMLWGKEPCDGILNADRCTRCRLTSFGMSRAPANVIARAPRVVRGITSARQGKIWTALRMRDLIQKQQEMFLELMSQANALVALCEWTRALMLNNHAAREKIFMIPHGLDAVPAQPYLPQARDEVRLIVLGRLDKTKGIDLVIRAMLALPDLPLRLDVFAIVQSQNEPAFVRDVRELASRDARIQFKPAIPHAQIIPLLQTYDALLIPSRWLETGPMVLLEAFAAGIPVIGSDLGGIAEKVKHETDGLLVPCTVAGWTDVLRRIAADRTVLPRLRANVKPPRTMDVVAREMRAVYETVLRAQNALPT